MKSTYKISTETITRTVEKTVTTAIVNKLKQELPEFLEGDPWILTKKIFLALRGINLDEYVTLITMFLINGDSFDESISLLSVEFHKKKFPRLEE